MSTWALTWIRPGAGRRAGRAPQVDRPVNPMAARRGTRGAAMAFQGGTRIGSAPAPSTASAADASAARPARRSARAAASSRDGPNSAFLRPAGAWFR